jgi:hypothetical protein
VADLCQLADGLVLLTGFCECTDYQARRDWRRGPHHPVTETDRGSGDLDHWLEEYVLLDRLAQNLRVFSWDQRNLVPDISYDCIINLEDTLDVAPLRQLAFNGADPLKAGSP